MLDQLTDELHRDLQNLISDRIGDGLDLDVQVTSIRVLEDSLEIKIEVKISGDAEPAEIADRYFGLTGKVRNALGDQWRNFYPVITPLFDDAVHA